MASLGALEELALESERRLQRGQESAFSFTSDGEQRHVLNPRTLILAARMPFTSSAIPADAPRRSFP